MLLRGAENMAVFHESGVELLPAEARQRTMVITSAASILQSVSHSENQMILNPYVAKLTGVQTCRACKLDEFRRSAARLRSCSR